MSLTCTAYRFAAVVLLSLAFCTVVPAQDTTIYTYRMASADTIKATIPDTGIKKNIPNYKKRQWLVGAGSVAIYGGALLALNQAWYADYPRSSFHTFNDNREWQQVDKVGHAWSAYQLTRTSYATWRWAGKSEKKAVLLSSLTGPGFLTVIETLDAFSEEWGWSWGDMGANVFGGGLFAAQQLAWHEQRIDFKFSFHRVNYTEPDLLARANNLYGKSFLERMLKDYNGQTYWLSANLHAFFPKSRIPAWLNVAVGYGATGMYGGEQNAWIDANNNVFTRFDIPRRREFYLAPDIKFSKIKTKSKALKTLFFVLDGFKFPSPALVLSKGRLKVHGFYF